MANKKISELQSRTPVLADLMLVGDPSSGYAYKCTITALSTVIETAIGGNYVTLATTQTISGAKTFSNNVTLTSVQNAPTDPDKFLTLNASNVVTYRTGAEVLSDIGGQGSITLTTTGTSGAATLVGNTLNIPQYSPDLSGYVPNTRTLTINGTSYDLSANRTWSVGTVTSVAATAGTGISISGSPITSSGTLTITNTAPDQTVVLTAGTGISVSGTYPSFTIAATSTATISGSGTTNYIPKFTSSSAIGNSVIYESVGSIGIGTTSPITFAGYTSVATDGTSGSAFVTMANGTSALRLISSTSDAALWEPRNSPVLFGTNNTERLRITSTGLVGIGTSTPGSYSNNAYNLVVGGTLDAGITIFGNSAEGSSNLYLADGTTGDQAYRGFLRYTHSNDALTIGTSGITRMTLDASGNLGLGLTPNTWPAGQIAFEFGSLGTLVSTGSTVSLQNNSYNNGTNNIRKVIGEASSYSQSGGAHIWQYAASGASGSTISFSEAMRISSTGNVGIGTSSPSNILHLYKASGLVSMTLQTGTNYGYFYNDGNNIGLASDAGSTGLKLIVSRTAPDNSFIIASTGAATFSSSVTASGGFEIPNGQFYRARRSSGSLLTDMIGIPSGTDDVRILTTGDFNIVNGSLSNILTVKNGGNVGIGTTSPSEKLDLQGTMNINGASGTYLQVQYNGANRGYLGTANATIASGATTDLGISATSNLVFGTGGSLTERMRITSGGNVGIGSTSPQSILHLETSSGNGSAIRMVSTSTNGRSYAIGSNFVTGSGEFAIYDYTAAATRLWVSSTGLIGIATTSPSYTLDVAGSVNVSANNFFRYNGDAGIIGSATSIGGANTQLGIRAASDILFATNGANERMRITSGGLVGIGTSAPSYKFDVQVASNKHWAIAASSTGEASFRAGNDGYAAFAIGEIDASTLRLNSQSGGEVLINTTTDAGNFKLQVNGAIYSTNGTSENIWMNDGVSSSSLQQASNVFFINSNASSATQGSIIFRSSSAYTERMRITNSGEVYIAGTTDQGAYNLQVNGTGVWGAGAYVNGSDSALKQNIQPLDNSLDLVKQMKPVTYTYKESYSKDTSVQTGFIAQDLQILLKDKNYLNGIVKDGTYLSVAYQNLIPLLVKAIQEQQIEIEKLKNK